MNKLFSAFWKILVLAVVYFVVNAIMGILLPLSNDVIAAMPPEDQAVFMPLFLFRIFINMTIMYLALIYLRYRGWKLFLAVWMAFFGLFVLVNLIEIYWYNEAFPLLTYLDVTKMIISGLVTYGLAALVGVWLEGGFKREAQEGQTTFEAGRYGWRIGLFCVIYPLFYYGCGFIPWSFPEVREFYAGWALTREPIYMLLLFNVFRGALWFLFTLPLLLGIKTREQAFWLVPLTLFVATAVAVIMPSVFMPGIVRLAHFIELGFSMTVVGLFMVWLFLKGRVATGEDNG